MKKILITGASGYIGSQLIERLSKENVTIIGTDIVEKKQSIDNYTFVKGDLRSDDVKNLILNEKPNVIVHLAAIVSPTKTMTRDFIYDVEVNGTKKILEACVQANVDKIIVTSSGAAYGYYADNAEWLKEEDPIRGNQEFPYAWHKRVIEEMLAEYRKNHPELQQMIFRVSTILGDHTKNDITNLFEKRNMLGLKGCDTPFVIIWDQDLLNILTKATLEDVAGIYNVAGDGVLTLKQIASIIGKKYVEVFPGIIKFALSLAKPLRLSRYGPEQVKFLQYRPVLDNHKLKTEFGYIPQKTTKEAFLHYAQKNGLV
ncbi:MAG: SDR family oxidoreductase [Chitinophagales bacterium]